MLSRQFQKRSVSLYRDLVARSQYILRSRQQSTQPDAQQQQQKPAITTETNVAADRYQNTPYGSQTIVLDKTQKYIIKWFGKEKYNSIDDVPRTMPADKLTHIKDKARAKTSLVLIVFTVVGALVASVLGKRHRAAGHHRLDETMNERMSYSKTHQELAAHKYKD